MSVQAITWALGQKLGTSSMKILLIAVANYADEDGSAWPSQQKLSADTGLCERTVRRLLKQLEEHGLIRREKRPPAKSGLRRTDVLHLDIGEPVKMSGGEKTPPKPAKKCPAVKMSGGEKTTGQNVRSPPDTDVRPYVNPLRDISNHRREGNIQAVGIVELGDADHQDTSDDWDAEHPFGRGAA